MNVLITGANGFLGKNLQLHLAERDDIEVLRFTRTDDERRLNDLVDQSHFIFHLAGINRAENPREFITGNKELTRQVCDAVIRSGRRIPVVFTSSIQANQTNPYGTSKMAAEATLWELKNEHGSRVHIFRLPNLFGKWSKPNYNSVTATFCYNIARGLPITINDPNAPITLVYVDDVISRLIGVMDGFSTMPNPDGFAPVGPEYKTTVGKLAEQIHRFAASRSTLFTEPVGEGFTRALYATYLSYLPTEAFTYPIQRHEDPRGVFAEMLKTPDCGQFSYFTAHPGVTRGGHYHHSKTEKFLVIQGRAHFTFRHMDSGEQYEITAEGGKAEVVETVPGWAHDITNIGNNELIVMLWANEVFDPSKPDTYSSRL